MTHQMSVVPGKDIHLYVQPWNCGTWEVSTYPIAAIA